jgi:uncharacterized membrane protein YgdD (TMEM256/DUF423 family)
MPVLFLACGAVAGFCGVALGAFAAHALRTRLAPDALAVFETAVRYQMLHALALVAVGLLAQRSALPAVRLAGWAFVAGIVLFSGSLFALALTGIRSLGAITPLGGVAFLVGWAALLRAALQLSRAG